MVKQIREQNSKLLSAEQVLEALSANYKTPEILEMLGIGETYPIIAKKLCLSEKSTDEGYCSTAYERHVEHTRRLVIGTEFLAFEPHPISSPLAFTEDSSVTPMKQQMDNNPDSAEPRPLENFQLITAHVPALQLQDRKPYYDPVHDSYSKTQGRNMEDEMFTSSSRLDL